MFFVKHFLEVGDFGTFILSKSFTKQVNVKKTQKQVRKKAITRYNNNNINNKVPG